MPHEIATSGASGSTTDASCSASCPSDLGCLIWIDRHVHKAGGTSIRQVFDELSRPYAFNEVRDGVGGKGFLRLPVAESNSNKTVSECRRQRWLVEAHEHVWHVFDQWVPQIRSFELSQPCCRILLTVRVREPLAHYLSFFEWASIASRYGRMRQTNNWTLTHLFQRWAPPNLQAANLLWSSFNGFAEGMLRSGGERQYPQFGEIEFRKVAAVLACDFDLVYPTERFADGLRVINQLLGLKLNASQLQGLGSFHASPRWGSGRVNKDEKWVAANQGVARFADQVCPNMTFCRVIVERLAPFDMALHRLAKELFNAHLLAPGANLTTPIPLDGGRGRRLTARDEHCPPRKVPALMRGATAHACSCARMK